MDSSITPVWATSGHMIALFAIFALVTERERERQRDRERYRERDTRGERDTQIMSELDREKQTERTTDSEVRETDRKTE